MSNVTDDDDKIVKNSWTPEVRSTRRRETFSRRRRRHSGPRPTTVRKSFSSVTTVLNRSGLRALGAPTRPILAHETPDDVDLLTNTEHPYPNSAGGCAPSRADPEARGPGQLDRYRRGSARSLEQELSSEVSPRGLLRRPSRLAPRGSPIEGVHECVERTGASPDRFPPSPARRDAPHRPPPDFPCSNPPVLIRPPVSRAAGGATSSTPWSSAARSPRMRIVRSSWRTPSTGTSGRSSPDPSPAGERRASP